MPVYINPRTFVSQERAKKDSSFYYDCLIDNAKDIFSEDPSPSNRQYITRLKIWISKYRQYAINYHLSNFIKANDIYQNPEDACKFPINSEIPRAPYLEVFSEIPSI